MDSVGKGYVHLYTGDGKGKTTAAFGLALRSLGAGLKVAVIQFLKDRPSSEVLSMKRWGDSISIELFGRKRKIKTPFTEDDVKAASSGFDRAREIMKTSGCDVLILDEINCAVHYNLLDVDEVIEAIRKKPNGLELVLTGRYAPEELYGYVDLITEMIAVKHYREKGVPFRKGIEL